MNPVQASLTLIACALLASCGLETSTGRKASTDSPTLISLKGKKGIELVRAKYERAQLECALEFSIWEKPEGDLPEVIVERDKHEVSWNLIQDDPTNKIMELRAALRTSEIRASIQVESIEVADSREYRKLDGKVFKMQFSPTLKTKYSYDKKVEFIPGQGDHVGKGVGIDELIEGTTTRVLDFALSKEPNVSRDKYATKLDCDFKIKLKPAYEEQYFPTPEVGF